MSDFRDAYGKHTTPEAEYQNGYQDGYAAGKEECADEIARLREDNAHLDNVWLHTVEGRREQIVENKRLRAENARLREALEKIANNADQYSKVWVVETARAALAGEKKDE